MKSCFQKLWLQSQQNHRARKERRDKYWAARRKQYLAAERRKQRLAEMGPIAQARMERKEIARRDRKYNAYRGAKGVLISMNAWAKPQSGSISVKAMLAIGLLIAWMLGMLFLPLMFMSGLLGIFAQKLFELPGLKQITQLFLKIACSEVAKAIGDKLSSDQNLFWIIPSPSAIIGKYKDMANAVAGAFSSAAAAPLNVTAKIFKTAGTALDGVPLAGHAFKFTFDKAAGGAAIAADATGAIAGSLPSLIESGLSLAETGLKALKQLQNFSCMLEAMFEDFKHQGLDDPFRAAISCANWPDYLGSIKSQDNSTSSGVPKYCVDNRNKNDAQGLIPAWLKPIYQAAGQQYNLPWELLAAINWNDTEYGAKELNADQKKHAMKVDPKNSSDLQALDSLFGISTGIPRPDAVGQKFLDYYNLKGNAQVKAKDRAKGIIEAATQVVGEWQQPNNQKLGRAGWIPLSQKEWDKAGGDWGYVPPDWKANPYGKSAQACPMPISADGGAVAGGTPLPAQDIGGGGTTTKGQNQFSERLAAVTGLDVNLVKGWALAEMSGSYALGREAAHNYNWLNIGYYDSLGGGGAFQGGKNGSVWSNPITAADASAAFLEGHFLGASSGIQHIIKSAGKSVATQIDFIATSGWASSGYRNGADLRGTYKIVKHTKQPARIKVKWRHPKTGKMFTLGDGSGEGGSFVASNAPVNVSFVPDGNGDTCDPVDSIFALAHWLSINGAQGDSWSAALVAGEGVLNKSKVGGKITVIGDELADDNKGQLQGILEPSPLDFHITNGITTPQAVRSLRPLAKSKKLAPTVVMAVGNNNPTSSNKDMRAWIRGTMDITGSSRCVVWPTVWAGGRARFVDVLLQAEKNYDNLVVVRWDKAAKRYIDKNDPRKFHTNDQGIQQYSELIAQGVSRCAGGTSQPSGTGIKVTGRGSAFGAIYDDHGRLIKVDPGDVSSSGQPLGVACSQKGASHLHPGLAIRPGPTYQSGAATLCGWWWIKSPQGKTAVIQQIDIGPNQSTGRRFDLNDRATKLFGYKGRDSFPTDQGTWTGVYLGKQRPSDISVAPSTPASGMTLEGDSLSSDAPFQQSLRKQLHGWSIQIDAQGGRGVDTGLKNMRRLKLKPVVVFALGSNSWDVGAAGNRRWIQNALAQAGRSRCTVLTTVYTGGRPRPQWNDQVSWAAKHYGPARVQVADWVARLRRGDIHLSDGTHPSERDESKRATLIAEAARRCASKVGGGSTYITTPRGGSLKNLLSTKPPRIFRANAVPPIKYLKNNNSKLPSAAWRHAKADPLNSQFPSFNSGLRVRPMSGSNCDTAGVAASPEMQGLFYSASQAFSIPWQLLSAYAAQYSAYGCRPGDFSSVRPGYEMDANGDGRYNPADPIDAVFSNARSLASFNGSADPAAAARKLTTDTEMLMKIAYAARQLGYNSTGMVKLLDDGIGVAVDHRDHLINKAVCADQSTYVECIASLYRKIMGVEDSAGTPGGWLTGGCNPDPAPDLSLRLYSLNSQASKGANGGAYFKMPASLKGVYTSDATAARWARRDAWAGEVAALRTFMSCYPKYAKHWKDWSRMNDWGAGNVKAEWHFTCNCHHTHRNGADNDLNFWGVNEMNITMNTGVPYDRKAAVVLAKMFFRAGAYEIIFHDPAVRNQVKAARDKYARAHPDVIKKLGAHYSERAMYDVNDHSTHFHTHWYVPPQNNVPADVKVWITDQSVNNLKPPSATCKKHSSSRPTRGAGPWAKSLDPAHPCSAPAPSRSQPKKRSNNPLGPYGKIGPVNIPRRGK